MTDPLGLISTTSTPAGPVRPAPFTGLGPNARADEAAGPGFRETLEAQIREVNALRQDANIATEDLMTGRRDDIETVINATQKADLAFKMLLQLRNKMMDAYDEVKQIRV